MSSLRSKLKSIAPFKIAAVSLRQLRNPHSFFEKMRCLVSFYRDYRAYKNLPSNAHIPTYTSDLFPRIYDKTSITPLDPVYFYQDSWCAKKIFENAPDHHHDLASHAHMVGIISQFVPTTMVDIRPLPVYMPGLSFIAADITKLPFKDSSITSLSSICVAEHIGLGRYGDPLDQFGSEKAIAEMIRVLAPGGNVYISVPIDSQNRTYFNAHRAFTREYILECFKNLTLKEEKYIYGNNLEDYYVKEKGFGTGLYHFTK